MNKKRIGIFAFVFAVVLFILSVVMFMNDAGSSPVNETYGGDAYTGIQNAAAATARNVRWLNEAVCFGFGSVLLAMSFAFFLVALHFWSARAAVENEPNDIDLVYGGVFGDDDGESEDDDDESEDDDGARLSPVTAEEKRAVEMGVCPDCGAQLQGTKFDGVLRCPDCGRMFG